MRKLLYLLLIAVFAAAVYMKAQEIEEKRGKAIVTMASEYKKNGIPVDVFKVRKDNLFSYLKISGKFLKNEIMALVPSFIRNRLTERQPFSAEYSGKVLKGYVAYTGGMDINSGLYRIIFKFYEEGNPANIPQNTIIPLNVRSDTAVKVTVVPNEAINSEGKKQFVWEVMDNFIAKREVKTGEKGDRFVEIQTGIVPGAIVVAGAGTDFYDGMKVRIHKVIEE
jgi:hypothetical protein